MHCYRLHFKWSGTGAKAIVQTTKPKTFSTETLKEIPKTNSKETAIYWIKTSLYMKIFY